MFFSGKKGDSALYAAVSNSMAVIEFTPEGIILKANDNFCDAMGYTLAEIVGKHHEIFVDPKYAQSSEYQTFGADLKQGKAHTAQFPRYGKDGSEIWIQASYSPVLNGAGHVSKVIKFASDITQEVQRNADLEGQVAAIRKSSAVIEFTPDGTIITANTNFCNAVGYSLEEIQGKHHRIFVDPAYAQTQQYKDFWSKLGSGVFESGEYKRFKKDGSEMWLNASYNPILDPEGNVLKIVKFASDITASKLQQADFHGQLDAIGRNNAVIEFDLHGTIQTANPNFCNALGYTLDEIQGKHHRIFCDPEYVQTDEYKNFWERLAQGESFTAEYERFTKTGESVWIYAAYSPILDMNDMPYKVVKYARDITAQVRARKRSETTSEETLSNVQSVAAAAEEMTASVNEISNNMRLSKEAVDDIVSKSTAAGEASQKLIQSSEAMENVVKFIRDIAEQVNLLALNATIEAARAGDAGKGFAVVAAEVKNLASQTSKATDDIAREIAQMQGVSQNVDGSIKAIGASSDQVNQYVSGVASAIEEQTAVTQEISSNMQRATDGIRAIEECVKAISIAS